MSGGFMHPGGFMHAYGHETPRWEDEKACNDNNDG